MEKNLRLPKFISPRNPFKQEKAAEPATPPAAVAAPAVPVVAIAADVLPAKKISLSARVGGGLQKAILFCLDHNPFSAIGKPKLSGIPRFGKPAQQTELALGRGKTS
jgi:hypothetical protein